MPILWTSRKSFFRRHKINYRYIAYNENGDIVKGKLTAVSEEAAVELLAFASYRVIRLKPYTPFISLEKIRGSTFAVKPNEIILFCRQLATLIESGNNIAASLELLQEQTKNRYLKKILGNVISDVRGGNEFSKALSKFPKVFPTIYTQLLAVGEHSGGFETVLKQVADYMEREVAIKKETKGALKMPAITFLIAIVVIGIMITVVVPSFGKLYDMLDQELPFMARMLMTTSDIARGYGIYALLAIFAIGGFVFLYIKTRSGRYNIDRLLLGLPMLGHVMHLKILSRCCRSMSLLFQSGVPLTNVMPVVIQGCGNSVITEALTDVQQDMLKGQGLSRPMARNKLFLPMMVQMIRIGEESGNLNVTLLAVAQSYEAEADDKMHSLIALIQPVMTVFLGALVGIIAVSLFQTLYSMDIGGL